MLGIQDSADGPILASDVALLRDIDLPIWTVLKVLADAGMLIEDRTPGIDGWFTRADRRPARGDDQRAPPGSR